MHSHMKLRIYQYLAVSCVILITCFSSHTDVGELQCSNKKHVRDDILIIISSINGTNEVPPAQRINSLILRNGRNVKAEYVQG